MYRGVFLFVCFLFVLIIYTHLSRPSESNFIHIAVRCQATTKLSVSSYNIEHTFW